MRLKRSTDGFFRGLLLCLVTALALLPLTGCQVNPATGRQSLNMMSQGEEIQLGEQSEPQYVQSYGGEIPSARLQAYVSNVGQQLAGVSERAGMPWRFHAVNSSQVNAFALPGGKIFITRGLLERLSTEAQLAAVLGHECGHVNAQHIGQQMTRQTLVNVAIAGIGIAAEKTNKDYLKVLGVGAQAGGTLYLLSFSRDQETESDELGLRYMTKLGYDPREMLEVMKVLGSLDGGGMEILSTHPLPQSRIDFLNRYIPQHYPPGALYKVDAEAYKTNVLDELKRLPPAKAK